MNIYQWQKLRNNLLHDIYLKLGEQNVSEQQIIALHDAMFLYLNSEACINQEAEEVKNLKQIFDSLDKNVLYFMNRILSKTIEHHLMMVLPVNGKYYYNAGITKDTCGYGTNRIVAIVVNQLIKTNPSIQNIMMFPDNMVDELWTSVQSSAVAQTRGTGISYTFNAQPAQQRAHPEQQPTQPPQNLDETYENVYNSQINL